LGEWMRVWKLEGGMRKSEVRGPVFALRATPRHADDRRQMAQSLLVNGNLIHKSTEHNAEMEVIGERMEAKGQWAEKHYSYVFLDFKK